MNREVYAFLNSVRTYDLQIMRLTAQKRQLEMCLLPSGIRYDKDKVQTSPEDQLSKICADINRIDIKIAEIAIKKAEKILEIEKVINKLPEEEYKTVLTLCYIDHVSIQKIASMLGYSSDWVYKKRRKAIEEISKLI